MQTVDSTDASQRPRKVKGTKEERTKGISIPYPNDLGSFTEFNYHKRRLVAYVHVKILRQIFFLGSANNVVSVPFDML